MLFFIIALILIFVNIAIIFYDFFELIIALYEEDKYEVIEDYYIKKDSTKEFIKFSNGIVSVEIAIIEYNKKIKKVKTDCCVEKCLKNEKVFQEIEGIRYF